MNGRRSVLWEHSKPYSYCFDYATVMNLSTEDCFERYDLRISFIDYMENHNFIFFYRSLAGVKIHRKTSK